MADFEHDPLNPGTPLAPTPPLSPDPDPAPLSPTVPVNPPMIGEASPFDPVDGQNRDQILSGIRAWARGPLRAWTTAWQQYLEYWLTTTTAWLNAWIAYMVSWLNQWTQAVVVWVNDWTADLVEWLNQWKAEQEEYIDGHTLHTFTIGDVETVTPGTPAAASLTGPITDPVLNLEIPRGADGADGADGTNGLNGYGWWLTETQIELSGSTNVILILDETREPQVGDQVLSTTPDGRYGEITAIADPTHVTVTYRGTLRGPSGIADAGSVSVTTTSLAPGAAYQTAINVQQMIGAYQITTDGPCWVRIYAGETYMFADAARAIDEPIDVASDHGCYLDFVSTGTELSKVLTPGVQISDISFGVWMSVTNTSGSTGTTTVGLDYRVFKE